VSGSPVLIMVFQKKKADLGLLWSDFAGIFVFYLMLVFYVAWFDVVFVFFCIMFLILHIFLKLFMCLINFLFGKFYFC